MKINPETGEIKENQFTHQTAFHPETILLFLMKFFSFLPASVLLFGLLIIFRALIPAQWILLLIVIQIALLIKACVHLLQLTRILDKTCDCGCSIDYRNLHHTYGPPLTSARATYYLMLTVVSAYYALCCSPTFEQGILWSGTIFAIPGFILLCLHATGYIDRLQKRIDIATKPDLKDEDLQDMELPELEKCAALAENYAQTWNYRVLKNRIDGAQK